MKYISPVGTTSYNIQSLVEGEKVRLIHAPLTVGGKHYPNAVQVQVMRDGKPFQVGSLAESTDPRSGQQLVLNSNPPWDNQFLMGTIANIKTTDTDVVLGRKQYHSGDIVSYSIKLEDSKQKRTSSYTKDSTGFTPEEQEIIMENQFSIY